MRGQARTIWRMAKFFTIQSETNEVEPDFKEISRDWDRFAKLDPGMKCCLVDTMVVLPLHRGVSVTKEFPKCFARLVVFPF